ncbi:hypothetical protein ACFLWY_03825 [Chloroflexota bacterium]
MGTKAYLMVNLDKRFSHDGYYLDGVRELAAMPDVESVEPVSGICDLLVKVDAPPRAVSVASRILAKKWVKDLKILAVEIGPGQTPKQGMREQRERVFAHKVKTTI